MCINLCQVLSFLVIIWSEGAVVMVRLLNSDVQNFIWLRSFFYFVRVKSWMVSVWRRDHHRPCMCMLKFLWQYNAITVGTAFSFFIKESEWNSFVCQENLNRFSSNIPHCASYDLPPYLVAIGICIKKNAILPLYLSVRSSNFLKAFTAQSQRADFGLIKSFVLEGPYTKRSAFINKVNNQKKSLIAHGGKSVTAAQM